MKGTDKIKRITPEKQAEYLEHPNACPACDGPIQGAGTFKRPKRRTASSNGGFHLRFEVRCPRCGSRFIEVYRLVGVMAKRRVTPKRAS